MDGTTELGSQAPVYNKPRHLMADALSIFFIIGLRRVCLFLQVVIRALQRLGECQ
jgi:hypothetical protein